MANVDFFWATNSISVVLDDNLTVVAREDARYPWVVRAALLNNTQWLQEALTTTANNKDGQWTIEYQDTEENTDAWDIDGVVYFDKDQACACACEAFQENPRLNGVRVLDEQENIIYTLSR